jgi:hypothetical protein
VNTPLGHAGSSWKPSFLVEGGRMGELIAAHDWAVTPIGAIADWPHSLRTAVGICVTSRHPMVIWWGPNSC